MKAYIKNIEIKYDWFVPARTKVTISDVKQHLIDMYPRAFSRSSVATNNTNGTYDAGPSTSKTHNKSAARKISPVSLGSASLRTSYSSDSSDSDDADDFVDQRPLTPIKLLPVDIKMEQVVENYSQYNDKPNNESQASDNSVGDQGLDERNSEAKKNHKANRKRNTMREQPHSLAKKVCRASELNHSLHEIDSVIAIDDDGDDDDTKRWPISSQKPNELATNFDAMFDELCEIMKKVSKCEERLNKLNEQEAIIQDKLHQGENYGENLNLLLAEFCEVMKKISECKKQLKDLNEQKDIFRAKLKLNQD